MSTLPALLNPTVWTVLKEQANVIVASGFAPKSIKTAEQALAVMLKGHEMGLPPMLSLAEIKIIQGTPTMSASLMLAMMYKAGIEINFLRLTDEGCTMEVRRPGREKQIIKFDMEDAKRAGLSSNDSWRKYPRAMCRSRCTSEAARSVAPDIIMIGYTPDEIDPMQPVNIEDRMESIKVSSSAVEPIAIEQKNAGGYDPNNIKHKAALAKKLSEMNLSYLCDKVSIAMKGKNSKDLDNVVETVKLEDDLDFSLNLPFAPTSTLPVLTNGENVDTIVAEVKEEVKSDKQSVCNGISEETSRG
jgi:hypothetical protein